MKNFEILSLMLLVSIFYACDQDLVDPAKGVDLSEYSNQIILDWNLVALEAMGGPTYPLPLLNSRINAMMHIAMHDALNAIVPNYQYYAYSGKNPEADPLAAIASAAHAVLVVQFQDQEARLDEHLANHLNDIEDGYKKTAGIELGQAAAAAILSIRENDGAFQDPIGTTEPSDIPGVYQIVPPFDFVYAEFWRTMQPFVLEEPAQFRVEPFPALNSEQYAIDYAEVKRIGELNTTERSADETFLAKFWYELAEMGWNKIARIVAENQQLDLATTARMFALLDIALADAYIAGWDSKYHHNFWRPYTAIRADNDGNDQTENDLTWEPSEPTPPVPDYPSTHSALGNAAAGVLAYLVGDQTSFTFKSTTGIPIDQSRSFTSFSQAADENANSRVLAGIHFRSACNAGQKLGDEVSTYVVNNYLQPL